MRSKTRVRRAMLLWHLLPSDSLCRCLLFNCLPDLKNSSSCLWILLQGVTFVSSSPRSRPSSSNLDWRHKSFRKDPSTLASPTALTHVTMKQLSLCYSTEHTFISWTLKNCSIFSRSHGSCHHVTIGVKFKTKKTKHKGAKEKAQSSAFPHVVTTSYRIICNVTKGNQKCGTKDGAQNRKASTFFS